MLVSARDGDKLPHFGALRLLQLVLYVCVCVCVCVRSSREHIYHTLQTQGSSHSFVSSTAPVNYREVETHGHYFIIKVKQSNFDINFNPGGNSDTGV